MEVTEVTAIYNFLIENEKSGTFLFFLSRVCFTRHFRHLKISELAL
jgi:hypothetical protein